MTYTIKGLINKIHESEDAIAIYCETKEEAKLTIGMLHEHLIYWKSDESHGKKNLTYFDTYEKGIVYWISRHFYDFELSIMHSSIEYALKMIEEGDLDSLVKAKDIKFNLQNW